MSISVNEHTSTKYWQSAWGSSGLGHCKSKPISSQLIWHNKYHNSFTRASFVIKQSHTKWQQSYNSNGTERSVIPLLFSFFFFSSFQRDELQCALCLVGFKIECNFQSWKLFLGIWSFLRQCVLSCNFPRFLSRLGHRQHMGGLTYSITSQSMRPWRIKWKDNSESEIEKLRTTRTGLWREADVPCIILKVLTKNLPGGADQQAYYKKNRSAYRCWGAEINM